MALGALAQAFASTPAELAAARFILGVGIGADYVFSPLINAEYANRRDRGKLMAISGGLMWSLGAVASAAALLLTPGLEPGLSWRVVLALSAAPALLVVYVRRKFPETPRYLLYIKNDVEELREKYGVEVGVAPRLRVDWNRVVVPLLLASLAWFLYDVAAYAMVFFGPNVMAESLGVDGALYQLVVFSAFVMPGNLIVALLVDRLGRRALQALGFAGMGAAVMLAAIYGMRDVILALILFGLYGLMAAAGPGTVVGFWGVELFPTPVRGLTSGITVVAGRMGVVTATLLVPVLLHAAGLGITLAFLGAVSLLGAVVTLFLEEPGGRSLDEFEHLEA